MNTAKQFIQDLSQANLHWAFQYIGLPWVNGAQGPNSFDCWSFLRFIQEKHYGINVPIIDVDADNWRQVVKNFTHNEERQHWVAAVVPKDGDAVLMRHSKYPSHVGVWLDVDGGGVLHCVRGEGVVFTSMTALKFAGWGKIEFYRHESRT